MWNYKDWLMGKLVKVAKDLGLDFYKFHIFDEQDFTKRPLLGKDDIYVIIKRLTASILFNTRTEPMQMMILSEENCLNDAMTIFKVFATENNFITTIDGDNYIKHQYTEPAVINNFIQVGVAYRSILYVSATLYTLENVVDVYDVNIDGEKITTIDFAMAYNLQTDSQPFYDSEFTKSVRISQTIGFSMTIPAKQSALLTKILNIVKGVSSGNQEFNLTFKVKGTDGEEFVYNNLKLSGFTMATAPNEIPTIKIGLVY